MKKIIVLTLMICASVLSVQAQNLEKMSESKRNEHLIREAKKLVKKIAPPFYREIAQQPLIERWQITADDDMSGLGEEYLGRIYYSVTMSYDEAEESFALGFSSRALFWEHNGKAFGLILGNGGLSPVMLDDPEFMKQAEQHAPKVKYEKQPPMKKK